jgi:phage tail sheath protein FI
MAQEILLSPGVVLNENDTSQITQGTITAGLALVGPTVKGQPNIPTLVTSYSDFKGRYGDVFTSASANYEFLTSIAAYNYFQQGGSTILVTRVTSGSYTSATSSIANYTTSASFTLSTLGQGVIMNNSGSQLTNGALASGSMNNVRWEVAASDTGSGLFTLLIRQGDDTNSNKTVLETWTNISLDPNSSNYISRVIGDKNISVAYDSTSGQFYLNQTGNYPNSSRYVRVNSVLTPTPNYFLNDGTVNSAFTSSIPTLNSGSFNGATGNDIATVTNLFDNISTTTQGLAVGNYVTASNLLNNSEEYDYQLLATPGLTQNLHSSAVSSFVNVAENRGDCFYITDLYAYGATVGAVVNQAAAMNTNYAAAYWPWVQVLSQASGKLVWVPASTVMPGVYSFNDKVSAEWFAPAGLNRGGIGGALQAERKLQTTDRDKLYVGKVNPIASFPGVGLVAYGQKTLQSQASALDRVNVRRLLIALKRYIGNIAESLLFEQNTISTRNNFLSQVNPYLESVQQRQGLYAYKVVMDDTNNTADVIDRNQLVGQIYIQPTKTIEFIYLTFNITPTGVTFG